MQKNKDFFLESFNNQKIFFSERLSEEGYFIFEDVFKDKALSEILNSFLKKEMNLRPAKIGIDFRLSLNATIRNDFICWIDEDDSEFAPLWALYKVLTDLMRSELFLPIKRFESQMAFYPRSHYYQRHKDRHKGVQNRIISSVLYLNDWHEQDKGELIIFREDKDKIIVEPKMNRLVLFKSELEHEVLATEKPRKSIATWFRDDSL